MPNASLPRLVITYCNCLLYLYNICTSLILLQSSESPLNQLHSILILPSSCWSDQTQDKDETIMLCRMSHTPKQLTVTHSLSINADLSWTLFVNQHQVEVTTCSALKAFAGPMSTDKLSQLLLTLDRLPVCAGQPDDHFMHMILAKKGRITSNNGKVVAYVDNAHVELNGDVYTQTIRTSNCELISHSVKCSSCTKYRPTLRSMYHRWNKRQTQNVGAAASSGETSKFTNERYMNTPEKRAKIDSLRKRAYTAEQRVTKLCEKIHKLTQEQGDVVEHSLNSDLLHIMNENSDQIKKAFPEDSFARLFWEEQLKAATASNAKQVRWHPVIIKWCLNLKLMSSCTYHALRSSGFLKLPSERTLRDYTHYFQNKPGFQDEVNQQLLEEVEKLNLPAERKYVGLLIDEMKVKEGLVYNKLSGEIVGFTNLGDVNDQLLRLEQGDEHPPVAKYILVLMVRGVMFKLEFPYAHFGTRGVTGELLHPIVWEAIRRLEASELKVIFITADGASVNRKFFRMHQDKSDPNSFTYKARNPYSADNRWVYFIADTPHLMKTVRNCWSHSGVKRTRHMQVRNNFITIHV